MIITQGQIDAAIAVVQEKKLDISNCEYTELTEGGDVNKSLIEQYDIINECLFVLNNGLAYVENGSITQTELSEAINLVNVLSAC